MKNLTRFVFVGVLVMMAGTAVALAWLKSHQKLGKPGIIATPIPGTTVMNIELPDKASDFTATTPTNLPEDPVVLGYLPKDTSYAQKVYLDPNTNWISANIILMGADRTSIHNPDYCLPAQGFTVIDKAVVNIPIGGPHPYELPVSKWVGSKIEEQPDGTKREIHMLYVFWFVAENKQTTSNTQRIKWLMRDLLRTGVLQRWAYISFQARCYPGQEDAVFARMKDLIAASVPDFQLPLGSANASLAEE